MKYLTLLTEKRLSILYQSFSISRECLEPQTFIFQWRRLLRKDQHAFCLLLVSTLFLSERKNQVYSIAETFLYSAAQAGSLLSLAFDQPPLKRYLRNVVFLLNLLLQFACLLEQIYQNVALSISHYQCILHRLFNIIELFFQVYFLPDLSPTGGKFFSRRISSLYVFLEVFNLWGCKFVHCSEFLPNLVVLGDWESFLQIGGHLFSSIAAGCVPGEPVIV